MTNVNVEEALRCIRADLNRAWRALERLQDREAGDFGFYLKEEIDCAVERSFITLLLLCEVLNLEHFRLLVQREYNIAKKQKGGFGGAATDPEGYVYLLAARHISKLLEAFKATYGLGGGKAVNSIIRIKDVLQNLEYSLSFSNGIDAPSNEAELHKRVEVILRCVYPDLKHKPAISKPIKSFEPDTGIPSIKTLIEYKYVASQSDVKRVSDEILADTQGYRSRDWNTFIYLIYETSRFQAERKWGLHLAECGNPPNTHVIVIRGERPLEKVERKKTARP